MAGIKRLTARFVDTVSQPGYYPDGAGLYLQVSATGTKSWILRYKLRGRSREMGLGGLSLFSLQEARERAQANRQLLADGIDPIDARRAQTAGASSGGRTWGEAVDDFIECRKAEWKNDKQADQWAQSLRDHGPERSLPVTKVSTDVVLAALSDIWTTKTETATRVRGRIERVWAAERVKGKVTGENPASWKGHLDALLPRPSKVAKAKHFKSMPYSDLPAFYQSLGTSTTAKALKFTILTAARTNETIGMHMGEVRGDLWILPAERMKGGIEHRVPLVPASLALLPRTGRPFGLSNMAMLNLLQKPVPQGRGLPFTVHGFRASFRTWVDEETHFGRELGEMALAHTIKGESEAAYRRGRMVEKRRPMMEAWAAFLEGRAIDTSAKQGD